MTTNRVYNVSTTNAGELTLTERRRVLRTTPVDGCASVEQCELHYEEEQYLSDPSHPIAREERTTDFVPTFSCEPDTSRPGPNRCVMTCEDDEGCEAGFACSGGFCVEGVIPPEECLPALQRVDLRAGNSFAVVGSSSGFYHRRIAGPGGQCDTDLTRSALLNGRIPLVASDCTGAIDEGVCGTTEDVIRETVPTEFVDDACVSSDATSSIFPGARVLRYENPEFSFRLVEPVNPGDGNCIDDRLGADRGLAPFAAVHPGFSILFSVTGGRSPLVVDSSPTNSRQNDLAAALPARVVLGPKRQIWLLDQGDVTSTILGTLYKVNPDPEGNQFGVTFVR